MDGSTGRGRTPGQRLFGTTKGKLLALLCQGRRTVGELAAHLSLTGNAVRAQLSRLQRDGLVRQAGSRRGVSKPHVDYELTPKARELFPRAYEPVLRQVVDALAGQLGPEAVRRLFAGVALGLLREHVGAVRGGDPRRRLSDLVARFGGAAVGIELERHGSHTVVRPCSCPIASVTAAHPELCSAFAGAIGVVLGTEVREKCERGDAPRCGFQVEHGRG